MKPKKHKNKQRIDCEVIICADGHVLIQDDFPSRTWRQICESAEREPEKNHLFEEFVTPQCLDAFMERAGNKHFSAKSDQIRTTLFDKEPRVVGIDDLKSGQHVTVLEATGNDRSYHGKVLTVKAVDTPYVVASSSDFDFIAVLDSREYTLMKVSPEYVKAIQATPFRDNAAKLIREWTESIEALNLDLSRLNQGGAESNKAMIQKTEAVRENWKSCLKDLQGALT